MKALNKEVVSIALHEDHLYQMNFIKMHEADATNLAQSWKKNDALELSHHELGHLNVKSLHAFQNTVNDMDMAKNCVLHLY